MAGLACHVHVCTPRSLRREKKRNPRGLRDRDPEMLHGYLSPYRKKSVLMGKEMPPSLASGHPQSMSGTGTSTWPSQH